MSSSEIPHFFVIGAQRSGTTLLRLMLNSHPDLAIPEEGTFWMPLLRDCGKNVHAPIPKPVLENYLRYINKNSQFKLWLLDDSTVRQAALNAEHITLAELMRLYYGAYMQLQGKTRVGDKTPSFFRMIPMLNKLFPMAKFIHIVRDGRDIYLSLRKMGCKDNISVGAMEWGYKFKKAQSDLAALDPSRVFTLRYEDLLLDPAGRLQEICTFLSAEYDPSMLDFWKNSGKFIGAHHSTKIFGPISADNVNKWKTRMAPSEVSRFQKVVGSKLQDLGYDIDSASYPGETLRIAWDLAYGVPCRLARVAKTVVQLKITSRLGLGTDAAGKGVLPNNKQKC